MNMNMSKLILTAMGIALLAGVGYADIINGNFDTDLSGWTTTGGGWYWFDASSSSSPDGAATIFFGGSDTWLYQPGCTATFVEGQQYALSFLASGSGTSVGTTFEVNLITGSGLHAEYVTLTGGYVEYSLVFTATAADVGQTFQPGFLAKGGLIVGLDSVSLTAVPEPATMTLLAAGAVGILSRRRRK